MSYEELKIKWIREQLDVASKVIVLPNPTPIISAAINNCEQQDRFVAITLDNEVTLSDNDDNNTTSQSSVTKLHYYGGVDVSFPDVSDDRLNSNTDDNLDSGIDDGDDIDDNSMAVAVYVVIEYPTMNIVYTSHKYFQLTIPYIPSFLAFREIDPIQSLIQEHQQKHTQYIPSVIFVDGNGIYHTRSAGLACFVGIRTNIPTVGIGKSFYSCNFDDSNGSGSNNNNGSIDYTKEFIQDSISKSIDSAVRNYTSPTKQQNRATTSATASQIPVVLFDRYVDQPGNIAYNDRKLSISGESDSSAKQEHVMESLARICYGLAIPIEDRRSSSRGNNNDQESSNNNNYDFDQQPHSRILAYALVGHGGGRLRLRNSSKQQQNGVRGTKNPIYISLGHNISLQDAVRICCLLCANTRIPEPIRQADLIGRALLRQKKQKAKANQQST